MLTHEYADADIAEALGISPREAREPTRSGLLKIETDGQRTFATLVVQPREVPSRIRCGSIECRRR